MIDGPGRLSCKAIEERTNSPQLEQIVHALTAQPEVMVTIMTKLEAIELGFPRRWRNQSELTVKWSGSHIECQERHRLSANLCHA